MGSIPCIHCPQRATVSSSHLQSLADGRASSKNVHLTVGAVQVDQFRFLPLLEELCSGSDDGWYTQLAGANRHVRIGATVHRDQSSDAV